MKISIRKYAGALAECLMSAVNADDAGKIAENFLRVLRKHKKTKLLKRFMPVFTDMWHEKNGVMEVKITTATEYGDEEKDNLKNTLSSILKKKIILREKVDKEVIGGFKMEFSDYVLDGTVKKNLEILKSKLSNN